MVLILVSILIVIGLYGYFIVYPRYSEYKLTLFNLEMTQEELLEYKRRIDENPILEEELNELTEDAEIKSKKLSHDIEDG